MGYAVLTSKESAMVLEIRKIITSQQPFSATLYSYATQGYRVNLKNSGLIFP